VFDPLAVLLLVAANWNLKHLEKKDEFWRLSEMPKEMPNTSISKTEEAKEEIKINLSDGLSVDENVRVQEPDVDKNNLKNEDEELPEIKVDEPTKDWEPELYAKVEKKTLGRYMQEIGAKPPLTQSFLDKVKTVFNEPSVGVKTIEREVEELQEKNPK
jgi:hypothetical protein